MPEISRFFGVTIRMYHNDHPPPPFHAEYGGSKSKIEIETLNVLRGELPPRVLRRVLEWARLHESELLSAWDRTINHLRSGKIEPLE